MDTIETKLRINPLHPVFAAEISGLDLAKGVDAATFSHVKAAMDRYAVCIVRGPVVSDEQHIAFSRRLGQVARRPIRALA